MWDNKEGSMSGFLLFNEHYFLNKCFCCSSYQIFIYSFVLFYFFYSLRHLWHIVRPNNRWPYFFSTFMLLSAEEDSGGLIPIILAPSSWPIILAPSSWPHHLGINIDHITPSWDTMITIVGNKTFWQLVQRILNIYQWICSYLLK